MPSARLHAALRRHARHHITPAQPGCGARRGGAMRGGTRDRCCQPAAKRRQPASPPNMAAAARVTSSGGILAPGWAPKACWYQSAACAAPPTTRCGVMVWAVGELARAVPPVAELRLGPRMGLLGCGSGGIAQGEDPWPDLSEAAVKGAAGDRLAAFLVVDGHLDPGDGLVATAEARLAWREPDQHSMASADLGPPVAEGHLPAGDRRQAMAEQLQRARLAVVPRHHDVGAACLQLDIAGQLRPAHLVL